MRPGTYSLRYGAGPLHEVPARLERIRMARRNQSDAEGWAPPGGPWPVAQAQDQRWDAEQNRRLPPEPGGPPQSRSIQAPASQDLHWQPVDQAPAVDPW